MKTIYRAFSLTWPASDKRKRLHKKRVQLSQDWFGTPDGRHFIIFGYSSVTWYQPSNLNKRAIAEKHNNINTNISSATRPCQQVTRDEGQCCSFTTINYFYSDLSANCGDRPTSGSLTHGNAIEEV